MSTFWTAPTVNFFQTTLNGAINDSATTITLTSTTNLQAPGYLIIDRENSAGTATPSARELVTFTGISGNDVTGVTRAADGSTARNHNDGAIVEAVLTVGAWNSLVTVVASGFTGDGYLKAIASPVSIARAELNQVYASIASLAYVDAISVRSTKRVDASGASVTGAGVGLYPVFKLTGAHSGASAAIGGGLVVPRATTLQWANIILKEPVSTASLVIDVNKNLSSIFNAGTRMSIAAGGTFVSTASIATKNLDRGDLLTPDVDAFGGANGFARDITIQLGGY